jgi:hypothetical protein
MEIRIGNYTNYEGLEIQFYEDLYEHPLPNELRITLSYPISNSEAKEGFFKNEKSGVYTKKAVLSELSNAFNIQTKAIYMGENFLIHPYFGDSNYLHLRTKNKEIANNLGFVELFDGNSNPYYLGEIKVGEVEKIWEERKHTEYDLPMPDGLEPIMEIHFK